MGPVVALLLGGCGSGAEHREARPQANGASATRAIEEPSREPEPIAATDRAEPPNIPPPPPTQPTIPGAETPTLGAGTFEALRFGGEVLARQPSTRPWMQLAAAHERTGARLAVTLRFEPDPFGPRNTSTVRWLEPRGTFTDADFVGRWAISGSTPSGGGGAIGWRREYALNAGGAYVFDAYPARTSTGTWRRVEGDAPRLTLDGASDPLVVGLVRDPAFEPTEAGPLRNGQVRVVQSDAPPARELDLLPSQGLPQRVVELETRTDAEGVLTVALEPWAASVVVYDRTHRVTLTP